MSVCPTLSFFSALRAPPPSSPLFPYTTLFRSLHRRERARRDRWRGAGVVPAAVLRGDGAATSRGPGSVPPRGEPGDRKSTRLNSSHTVISYAVFCLKKKK